MGGQRVLPWGEQGWRVPRVPGRSGCAAQGAAETCGTLGETETLPAPPRRGFGSSGAIPTMSPCHTAQPGPLPGPSPRAPSPAQGRDWGDTP